MCGTLEQWNSLVGWWATRRSTVNPWLLVPGLFPFPLLTFFTYGHTHVTTTHLKREEVSSNPLSILCAFSVHTSPLLEVITVLTSVLFCLFLCI